MSERMLRDYQILKKLGQGGMGQIWLVEHVHLKRRFALKMLHPELRHIPGFNQQFVLEARTQAALDHPNIVRVNDFFIEKDRFFMISDLVEGKTLEQWQENRGRLIEKEAIAIIKPVLQALNHAHSKGVIHQDVKPANIMITHDGQVKITDFSLATVAGAKSNTSKRFVGSPHHMSPEQIRNPTETDHRVDVYATGVVLYQLLTGELPFQGESVRDIWIAHLQNPIPDLKEKLPRIHPQMAGIIRKALAKNPDHRFAGCGEFLEFISLLEQAIDEVASDREIDLEDWDSPAYHWIENDSDLAINKSAEPDFVFEEPERPMEPPPPPVTNQQAPPKFTNETSQEGLTYRKVEMPEIILTLLLSFTIAIFFPALIQIPIYLMPDAITEFMISGTSNASRYTLSIFIFLTLLHLIPASLYAYRYSLKPKGLALLVGANLLMILILGFIIFPVLLPFMLKVVIFDRTINPSLGFDGQHLLRNSQNKIVACWFACLFLSNLIAQTLNWLLTLKMPGTRFSRMARDSN